LSGTVESGSLFISPHGDFPCLATLGPGCLEHDMIALICKTRLKLDGLFPPQAEDLLQFETHPHMPVADLFQICSG